MTARRIGIGGWILAWGPSGVARRLEALTEAAVMAGAEVTFFAPAGQEVPPGIAHSGADIRSLPIGPCSTRQRARAEERLLPALVREHNLDLLHLPHAPAPRLPLPLSVTVHDLRDFTRHARPGRRLAAPLLWRLALRRADIILAVSEYTAAQVRRFLPGCTGRTRVVPTSLPRRFPAPAGPSPFAPGSILTTGRPLPHKNPRILLDAYKILKKNRPGVPPLLWVGEWRDPRAPDLPSLVRQRNLAGQVILAGAVAEEILPAIYRSAAFALFPSLYEGQGLGLLEAMAAGTPVAASDIPAHRETGGDAALYFDPREPLAATEAMIRLIDDPGLGNSLVASSRENLKRYTLECMSENLAHAWGL